MKITYRPLAVTCLYLFVALNVYGKTLMTPQEITLSFIHDFKQWNDYAFDQDKKGNEKAQWNIEKIYDDIILKYCRETLKYQALAYGSESRHNPENEKIQKHEETGNKAIVYTKHIRKVANMELSDYYEYYFEKEENKWYLVSIMVVINGERYEGL